MPKETISVQLERETINRLSAMARATGCKRGALMTYAIEQYVENEAWQITAIQEAVDELERGEAGLVDHEDIATWLDNWGSCESGPEHSPGRRTSTCESLCWSPRTCNGYPGTWSSQARLT